MRAILILWASVVASTSATSSPRQDVARDKVRKLRNEIKERLDRIHGSDRKLEKIEAKEDMLRDLQSDPCTAIYEQNFFVFNGIPLWLPSFWQACAPTLTVDAENMLLHIASVNQIFRQYHCFYDIAKDPENSDPDSYQQVLGNTIFGFNGGGAVDLDAGFTSIASRVEQQGYASFETFWEMGMLFTALRDGHVDPPDVHDSFFTYAQILIPFRYFDQSNIATTVDYSMDDDGEINLTLQYTFTDTGRVDTLEVQSIGGYSVKEWLMELASHPAVYGANPTVGGRMNQIMRLGLYFNDLLLFTTLPYELMPDFFPVVLKNGETVMFRNTIIPNIALLVPTKYSTGANGTLQISLDRQAIEDFMNQPGQQYAAYIRSIAELPDDFGNPARTRDRQLDTPRMADKHNTTLNRKLQDDQDEKNPFDHHEYRALDGDVLLYKFDEFNLDPDQVIDLWNNLTNMAIEGAQNKLLIDLSGNSGGSVLHWYTLAMSMFPEVGIEWFSNQWDYNFNDAMTQFVEVATPLLGFIEQEYVGMSDEEKQARIDRLTVNDFANYALAVEGMRDICYTNGAESNTLHPRVLCASLDELVQELSDLSSALNVPTYEAFINKAIIVVTNYNSWVAFFGSPDLIPSLYDAGPVSQIRGGVTSETTIRLNIVEDETLEEGYDWAAFQQLVISETQGRNPFDEIIFLSDGNCASSGAMLPYTASQLYKNRERTGAQTKISLVAFGGSGNFEDMTFATIPASVQNIHLEFPIIGDAALQLIIDALPTTMTSLDEIVRQAAEYSASIAIPPYFASNIPSAPVVNFYDVSMEPGALPLQFVRIPLDKYIPKLLTNYSFEDGSNLEDLYSLAIALFGITAPTQSPVQTMPPTKKIKKGNGKKQKSMQRSMQTSIMEKSIMEKSMQKSKTPTGKKQKNLSSKGKMQKDVLHEGKKHKI
ncbi:hypothetical protein ACA910_012355 [Epithemia clementina (nom. ined.)]